MKISWVILLFSPLFGTEYQPIGILAFPGPQQLSPLVSFGQTIIDQGASQPGYFGDCYFSSQRQVHDAVPNSIFGITDTVALYVEFPAFTPYSRDKHSHSHGLEDTYVQLEMALYSNDEERYIEQATIVSALILPTGSTSLDPPTGIGNIAYLVGATFSHTGEYWYYFTSGGAVLISSEEGTRNGNLFLYQCGIGRWIATIDSSWLICWLVEFNGQFQERNRFRGKTVRDSGGSFLYITPSIWVSNYNWRFQLGAGYAVQQNLFGNQSRLGGSVVFDITYTFY